MKTFLQNLLIVGGIYFIISFVVSLLENDIIDAGLFLIFIIMLVVLCFKKNFRFVENLQNKMPRICNYLKALGAAQLFALCFISIPGMVYGYNAAQAQYQGVEYQSVIPQYLGYAAYIYLAILVIALLFATYQSFIKSRQK